MTFTAWSPALSPEKAIPENYLFSGGGCKGKNISPPIKWKEAPANAKSFAVTVHDPDAPKIGGWWHWAVVNIPASITQLYEGASNENKLPANALELKTDFGDVHYGGPCPPKGDKPHHYTFTVYALKNASVHITPNSTPGSIKNILEHESLAKSSFTVEYGR